MKKLLFFVLALCPLLVFGQAILPVNTGNLDKDNLPTGFSQTGLSSNYSGPKLKFNGNGDQLNININGEPGTLTFMLGTNNSFTGNFPSGLTFKVQESSDGTSYTDIASYTGGDAKGLQTISTFNSSTRYIRFLYSQKPSGYNVALYNIDITAPSTTCSISNLSASATCSGNDAVITVNYTANNSSSQQVSIDGGTSWNPITTGGTVTITGPTSATTTNIDVRDATDNTCSANVTIGTPTCPPFVFTPGDIAFVNFNTTNNGDFTFVTLKDLPADTDIHFTDNGWKSDNTFRANEGVLTWTTPSDGVPCGIVIKIAGTTITPAAAGAVTSASLFNMSGSGDQIIAYTGTTTSPTFIAAVNFGGDWKTTGTIDANTSYLPTGLVNGETAIAVDPSVASKKYGEYNGAILCHSRTNVLKAINNFSNWNTTNSAPYPDFNKTINVEECGSSCGDKIYRTKAGVTTGNWNDMANWESSTDGTTWNVATDFPSNPNSDKITIRYGTTITINTHVATDHLEVEAGATLIIAPTGASLEIHNSALGVTGADFILNGTLEDKASGGGNGFLATKKGGTWTMGANAMLIKTGNASVSNYKSYEGGIASIPSTANWIYRYTGNQLSVGGGDMVYPNLTFESTSGNYDLDGLAETLGGGTNFVTIKGNLNIGGTGSGTITVRNTNTHTSPMHIQGNMEITTNGIFRNYNAATTSATAGTGLLIDGNLTIAGTLDLNCANNDAAASDGKITLKGNLEDVATTGGLITGEKSEFEFNGTTKQTVFGTATRGFAFSSLIINNAADVELTSGGSETTIGRKLTLTAGKVILNDNNFTLAKSCLDLAPSGSITANTNNSSYLQTNGTGKVVLNNLESPQGTIDVPVGNAQMNWLGIQNTGTADDFSIQVKDEVLADGTSGTPVTTNAVNVTWDVSESTIGGSDVTFTGYWSASQQTGDFVPAACWLAHYTGGAWSPATAAATGTGHGGMSSISRSGITSFSPFAVGSGGPLPVELLSFTGRKANESVVLNWATATEINNDRFEVEFSKNGKDFVQIGEVAGNGNATEEIAYDFTHDAPAGGINYYRLKQVDFDGTYEYSKVIEVKFYAVSNNVYVRPTIVTDKVELVLDKSFNQVAKVQIVDVRGNVVMTSTLANGETNLNLNIAHLANGHYFVKVSGINEIFTTRFIKQ